jgi:hypothetical protein
MAWEYLEAGVWTEDNNEGRGDMIGSGTYLELGRHSGLGSQLGLG